jgi:hypothetical protein
VEGEKTGDGISYASHVKNPNPLKARATTFYDPVHNALDKEAQGAWKEGEGSHWPSVVFSPSTGPTVSLTLAASLRRVIKYKVVLESGRLVPHLKH